MAHQQKLLVAVPMVVDVSQLERGRVAALRGLRGSRGTRCSQPTIVANSYSVCSTSIRLYSDVSHRIPRLDNWMELPST